MSYNCPICKKAGLPNFKKSKVVCPQCNSDLEPFLLLDTIAKSKKNRPVIYVSIGLSILVIMFLGLLLKSNSEKKEAVYINTVLSDSILNLKNKNITIEKAYGDSMISENKEATLNYVVKKGDNPYNIARFFYNDGNKYTKIEADNNLKQPYILNVGQILIIKIPQ